MLHFHVSAWILLRLFRYHSSPKDPRLANQFSKYRDTLNTEQGESSDSPCS